MSMNVWKKITLLVFFCTLVFVIVFDVLALNYGGAEATLSGTLYDLSREMPIVPFALGIVCGHLMWPLMRDTIGLKKNNKP